MAWCIFNQKEHPNWINCIQFFSHLFSVVQLIVTTYNAFISPASKYKNTPNSRSYNANQYKSERTLECNLPGPSQSGSKSPSRSRRTTEETVGKRSPVEGGRFTSTAERVRLEIVRGKVQCTSIAWLFVLRVTCTERCWWLWLTFDNLRGNHCYIQ